MIRRLILAIGLAVAISTAGLTHALADATGSTTGDGTLLNLQDLHRWRSELASQVAAGGNRYEYKTVDACGDSTGAFDSAECYKIGLVCFGFDGPLVDIFRRTVSATGVEVAGWIHVAQTCLPNDVPGVKPRPTMRMIINAMHLTPWAKASVGFQPKGNKTLVNLPNFYAASWSEPGFGPGEIDSVDPATMYGYTVQIRPRLVSYTYHFGDGTALGPTLSPGGVYPNGDVRHTYAKPGIYQAHITVQWGADFRVNRGTWAEVPDTVTVEEPAAAITAQTATNRLVR